jgi:CheY-like chemotaxis protein
MFILVVEDDYLQAEWICKKLKQVLHCEVQRLSTESQFRKQLHEIEEHRPDIVIMDVMLPWTDPSPNIEPPPPEVIKEGFYRAGVRCTQLLIANEKTKSIPVILYTVLERADLEDQLKEFESAAKVVHLQKGKVVHLRKDSDDDRLIDLVRELTD